MGGDRLADDVLLVAVARNRASRRTRESKNYRVELRALGLRIRTLREKHALTLEGAAEVMDVDPTHLAKIEAGTINVTFATLVRIARGLDETVPGLFGR